MALARTIFLIFILISYSTKSTNCQDSSSFNDEENKSKTTQSTKKQKDGFDVELNITDSGLVPCDDNVLCNDNGKCFVDLSNVTQRICRCSQLWKGDFCEIYNGPPEKPIISESYFVYAVAVAAGILLIILFVVCCKCYKKAENARTKRKLKKYLEKEEGKQANAEMLDLSYSNPRFQPDTFPRSVSQTDSKDSDSRVFHLKLNKKEKDITSHVIVEIDNDELNDSGVPFSSGSSNGSTSNKGNLSSDSSDILTNDQASSSSESPLPRHKQSRSSIFTEYQKKKQNLRRGSLDNDTDGKQYNPRGYYTTPNRGKNNNQRVVINSPLNQRPNHKTNMANVKSPRPRKHSEELLANQNKKQQRIRKPRSHSMGDLTDPSVNHLGKSQSYLDITVDSPQNLNKKLIANSPPVYATVNKSKHKGIWASSNERK